MDFGFSEEQEMLRQSARSLLERECPSAHVRQMMDDERGYSPELWRKMAGLGWLGLVLPEEHGGAGLNYVDLVVVAEEMGRVLLPSPFIWTLMFAEAINRAGSDEQKGRFLPAIARGELIATPAHLEAKGSWEEDGIAMAARKSGAGFVLEGDKLFVNDAHVADFFLVAARTGGKRGGGVTLFAIDAKRPGITVTPLKTMDQTRKLGAVAMRGVKASAADVVGEVNNGWPVLEAAIDRAKVALAAEMMGGAQKVLETTVEYTKVREQFGRPIGSFQAVQHKCANMMVDVEGREIRRLLRRVGGQQRRGRRQDRRGGCQGRGLRRLPAHRRRRHPGPWRDRFHLGARHASLLQARQVLGVHLRRRQFQPRDRGAIDRLIKLIGL